jgi:hypothetical protein
MAAPAASFSVRVTELGRGGWEREDIAPKGTVSGDEGESVSAPYDAGCGQQVSHCTAAPGRGDSLLALLDF